MPVFFVQIVLVLTIANFQFQNFVSNDIEHVYKQFYINNEKRQHKLEIETNRQKG